MCIYNRERERDRERQRETEGDRGRQRQRQRRGDEEQTGRAIRRELRFGQIRSKSAAFECGMMHSAHRHSSGVAARTRGAIAIAMAIAGSTTRTEAAKTPADAPAEACSMTSLAYESPVST